MRSYLLPLVVLTASLSCSAGIINPWNQEVIQSLQPAVKLIQQGQLDEGRNWLQKHFAGKPDQPHTEIHVAGILNQLGRGREARAILESLAVREPDRFDVRFNFCRMAVLEGRWFDGIQHANAAETATYPKTWTPRHVAEVKRDLSLLKATCYEGRGEWESAKTVYEKLTREDDLPAEILSAMGRCEFRLNNIAAATSWFDQAWRMDSQRDTPALALAVLFDADRSFEQAEAHFRKAVVVREDNGREKAQLAFARWLLWHNRPEEIATILAAHKPGESQTDRELIAAMAARMQRRFDKARVTLSQLHQQNPDVFAISNQLALVLIESADEGLRSRALQIAEANARNNPKLAEAWSTLGWIQFRLGDLRSARQNLSRGITSGVISRDTAWQLAQVHQKLGNAQEADKLIAAAEESQGPFFSRSSETSH